MIMCMYKKIAISNWELYWEQKENHIGKKSEREYVKFLSTILEKVDLLILREKSLGEEAYGKLASYLLEEAGENKEKIILHNYVECAKTLKWKKIHLPMPVFQQYEGELKNFSVIGVSTHSLEEAQYAQEHGATYITFSHIFETKCKEGLEPRGLKELEKVCHHLNIPVYALGGITKEREVLVWNAGAEGICNMLEWMQRHL